MKRFNICFFVLILITSSISKSQLKIDDEIIQSTAYLSYTKINDSTKVRSRVSGTGFIIMYVSPDTSSYCVLLVTNKHVLPDPKDSKTITIKIPYQIKTKVNSKEFNVDLFDKNDNPNENVRLNKNKNTDIAAINITSHFLQIKPHPSVLHYQILLKKTEFSEHNIGLGSEVFIIGYPNSIYDDQTGTPIVRVGTISTYPTKNFYFNKTAILRDSTLPNPLNGFLVDGSIFRGSSGSMVLLKSRYELTDPKKFGFTKEANYILGIVSRNVRSTIDGSLDIGIVFSSDAILETIEEFNNIFSKK